MLQHKLQETVSEQQKLHSQLEHHTSSVAQLERLSRSLKLQNEILCGKVSVSFQYSLCINLYVLDLYTICLYAGLKINILYHFIIIGN